MYPENSNFHNFLLSEKDHLWQLSWNCLIFDVRKQIKLAFNHPHLHNQNLLWIQQLHGEVIQRM